MVRFQPDIEDHQESTWDDVGISDLTMTCCSDTQEFLIRRNAAILTRALTLAVTSHSGGELLSVDSTAIEASILAQLNEYVSKVSSGYHKVHFHSFQHASHVVLNASYLVDMALLRNGVLRISTADCFYLIFAALIHDLDHQGVTNAQLIKENFNGLFTKYPNGSLAESNSIDVAITLLRQTQFRDFHKFIVALPTVTEHEEGTVNETKQMSEFVETMSFLILATDIMDPERSAAGLSKWKTAFELSSQEVLPIVQGVQREVIMEQLLQLADVAHCTQRWETFIKWNQRLYHELISAHKAGRGLNPSDQWYEGQIRFFDSYILPLTERVRDSGIFSKEQGGAFIAGALRNRERWILEGKYITTRIQIEVLGLSHYNDQSLLGMSGIFQACNEVLLLENGEVNNEIHGMQRLSVGTGSTFTSSNSGDSNDYANIWSKFTSWENKDWNERSQLCTLDVLFRLRSLVWSYAIILVKHPFIPLVFALICTVLCVIGLYFVKNLAQTLETEQRLKALDVTKDVVSLIKDDFDKMLVPMMTLALFIKSMDVFRNLPILVDGRDAVIGPKHDTHRNVSGICDNMTYVEPFQRVVQDILSTSSLSDLIVNIRAAPYGVMCLIEPLTNTRFGSTIDALPLIGNDWRWDVNNTVKQAVIRKTMLRNTTSIIGPLNATSSNGTIILNEMYCAHYPVFMPGYNFTFGNESISEWGFVMIAFDWASVKKKYNISSKFEMHKLEYKIVANASTPSNSLEEIIVAKSSGFEFVKAVDCVESQINAANGEWSVYSGYGQKPVPQFLFWIRIPIIVGSILFALLIVLVLIEKQLNKDLLYKMMPPSVVAKLNRGDTVVEHYNAVTIFFSDIVGFTNMAGEMSPLDVMTMLNDLYTEFDKLQVRHKVYKVETIGDSYMAVAGAPDHCEAATSAEKIALFALDVLRCVETFRTEKGEQIFIRAGIASGKVVAGVVGKAMPRYCFFGDTVNFASRMESTSEKMKIQCCDRTSYFLSIAPNYRFQLEERRIGDDVGVDMKGKGKIHTWWILSAMLKEKFSVP